jgi:hypothetical protein
VEPSAETRVFKRPETNTPKHGYKKPEHWVVIARNDKDAFCFGVFYTREKAEKALEEAGWVYDGEFWIEPPGKELLLVKRYWIKNKMKATVSPHEVA